MTLPFLLLHWLEELKGEETYISYPITKESNMLNFKYNSLDERVKANDNISFFFFSFQNVFSCVVFSIIHASARKIKRERNRPRKRNAGAWKSVRGSVNSDSRASSLIESAKAERRTVQKMAFTVRGLKVPPNSASLEEARNRVFDFFRSACRSLPAIMDIYNLDDVATVSQLRSTIASEIRKNSHVTDPKVIDMLLFKGMEELGNITEHAKQRHHIIGQYVVGREGLVQDLGAKDQGISNFLKNFYKSNYF
ncbi:unnamed protein product [Citrullus colocynthis]|uniref:NADH dehydrogenase [ubiquinone] 1 alpha subcomplex subunit 6 n=1 Tax=Citrullus colocynthis TaxID=252529 RepID=A0ABP0Y8W3_9ROSI